MVNANFGDEKSSWLETLRLTPGVGILSAIVMVITLLLTSSIILDFHSFGWGGWVTMIVSTFVVASIWKNIAAFCAWVGPVRGWAMISAVLAIFSVVGISSPWKDMAWAGLTIGTYLWHAIAIFFLGMAFHTLEQHRDEEWENWPFRAKISLFYVVAVVLAFVTSFFLNIEDVKPGVTAGSFSYLMKSIHPVSYALRFWLLVGGIMIVTAITMMIIVRAARSWGHIREAVRQGIEDFKSSASDATLRYLKTAVFFTTMVGSFLTVAAITPTGAGWHMLVLMAVVWASVFALANFLESRGVEGAYKRLFSTGRLVGLGVGIFVFALLRFALTATFVYQVASADQRFEDLQTFLLDNQTQVSAQLEATAQTHIVALKDNPGLRDPLINALAKMKQGKADTAAAKPGQREDLKKAVALYVEGASVLVGRVGGRNKAASDKMVQSLLVPPEQKATSLGAEAFGLLPGYAWQRVVALSVATLVDFVGFIGFLLSLFVFSHRISEDERHQKVTSAHVASKARMVVDGVATDGYLVSLGPNHKLQPGDLVQVYTAEGRMVCGLTLVEAVAGSSTVIFATQAGRAKKGFVRALNIVGCQVHGMHVSADRAVLANDEQPTPTSNDDDEEEPQMTGASVYLHPELAVVNGGTQPTSGVGDDDTDEG
jgi:hypothetical protein